MYRQGERAKAIFLYSGAEADKSIAKDLYDRLVAGGMEIHGSDLALKEADYVVVLWSRSSLNDAAVIAEARQALRLATLVQFASEDLGNEALPTGFRSSNCLRLSAMGSVIGVNELKRYVLQQEADRNQPLFSISSMVRPPGEAVGFVSTTIDADKGKPGRTSRSAQQPSTFAEALALENHYLSQTAGYATAAGTLTQFNAIVIALNAGFLTQSIPETIQLGVFAALLCHIVAAFLLCYALRPVATGARAEQLLKDTIDNYKRGWVVTVLAMLISVASLMGFMLSTYGLR